MAQSALRNANALFTLDEVTDALLIDAGVLRAEAAAEGFRFVDRLFDEWATRTVRFTKPNEHLLIARSDDEIAGLGGITVDPSDQNCLRMRRFYIRRRFRRLGAARQLAMRLIGEAQETGLAIRVNAGTDTAPAFWESLGFEQVDARDHTHVLPPGARQGDALA